MPQPLTAWTDEREQVLRRLWNDGLSARNIAARLGGTTREAVLGKLKRLGEQRKYKAAPAAPKQRSQRRNVAWSAFSFGQASKRPVFVAVEQPMVPASLPEPSDAPAALRVNLLDLREHMCRWPIGDPQDAAFHFCGRHKARGISYCDQHARQAYQPASRRRR